MTLETVPQHMLALARADAIRGGRAAVKRDLKAGTASIADVIDDECVASMRVVELLRLQPRWGLTRARGAIRGVPCSEFLTVGEMTERQRGALLDLLGGTS